MKLNLFAVLLAPRSTRHPKDRFGVFLIMPEMRLPISVALSILFFICVVVCSRSAQTGRLSSTHHKSKISSLALIYDKEMIKAKREEAKERSQVLAQKTGATPNGGAGEGKDPQTTPVKSAGKQQKVVSNIKLQGLSNLLGKISARANVPMRHRSSARVYLRSVKIPADRQLRCRRNIAGCRNQSG